LGDLALADFKRTEREAKRLLEQFGYTTPPIDPETIAEALGIDVVYADFDGEIGHKVAGFIEPAANRIVVNEAQPAVRKNYTIAHELGHHLMHREYAASENYQVLPRMNGYTDGGKPDEEREADAFAANLLVPLKMLRRYKDVATISELARLFSVSEEVIRHRLKVA
jgi:Zn-dependent peptidase ImmA (M78 family)